MDKKVFYTKSIIDDNGILIIRMGWYYEEAPYIGNFAETEINLNPIKEEIKCVNFWR